MDTQLASMVKNAPLLQHAKIELEECCKPREEDISGLNNTLAVVVQERDVLQAAQHICKGSGSPWIMTEHR